MPDNLPMDKPGTYSRMMMGMLGIVATALVVFAFVQHLYMRSLPPRQQLVPEAELSRMLGELHRALEDYRSERGQYPQQISAVMNERYKLGELKSPWDGQPLREIAAGTAPEAGCFSYIPHVSEGSGGLKVSEYILVGYGEGLAPSAPELPGYVALEEDVARRIIVSYRGGEQEESD